MNVEVMCFSKAESNRCKERQYKNKPANIPPNHTVKNINRDTVAEHTADQQNQKEGHEVNIWCPSFNVLRIKRQLLKGSSVKKGKLETNEVWCGPR